MIALDFGVLHLATDETRDIEDSVARVRGRCSSGVANKTLFIHEANP